jgi:hypothetical protein
MTYLSVAKFNLAILVRGGCTEEDMWVAHLEDDAGEEHMPRNEGEEDVLQVDPTSPSMLAMNENIYNVSRKRLPRYPSPKSSD